MVAIKFSYCGEFRRLSIDLNLLSYDKLVENAKKIFSDLGGTTSTIHFIWVDEEGDKIVLSTDDELKEALRVLLTGGHEPIVFEIADDNDLRYPRTSDPFRWMRICPQYTSSVGRRRGNFVGLNNEERAKLVENFLRTFTDISEAITNFNGAHEEALPEKLMVDDDCELRSCGAQSATEHPVIIVKHISVPRPADPENSEEIRNAATENENEKKNERLSHDESIGSELEKWSTELRILADMGFHDVNTLIPLLRAKCHQSMSEQQRMNRCRGKLNTRGLQRVVDALLG